MANPPVSIGPFTNVPAPGSPIQSAWAQNVSQYFSDAIRVYTTEALMNADPRPPGVGAIAITLDTGKRWIRIAGAPVSWHPLWPRLVDAKTITAAGTWNTTVSDVAGSGIAVPLYSGHRYHLVASGSFKNTHTAGQSVLMHITDEANVILNSANHYFMAANVYSALVVEAHVGPTAAKTYKLRVGTFAGPATQAESTNIVFTCTDYGIA